MDGLKDDKREDDRPRVGPVHNAVGDEGHNPNFFLSINLTVTELKVQFG